jgi:hypothetical protein
MHTEAAIGQFPSSPENAMNQTHREPLYAADEQTKEKPTTPSGDALDDTGQDNQQKKDDNAAEDTPEE